MRSPAKINLSLRILGKRPDGFHEIDTWMTPLPGLSDEITLTPAPSFRFTCSDPSLPCDADNLVVKAVHAFASRIGQDMPYHVHLEKAIPYGAGLGGGSSNAATTLLALNHTLPTPLALADLHAIAATLGSDVPFFLYQTAARCTGRGEIITPASPPPALPIVLLKPAFQVSTPDAYRNCMNATALPGVPYRIQTCDSLALINDLETPVFAKHRYLAELKLWLLSQSEVRAALMSGSGSTMYAILREGDKASSLIDRVRAEFDENLWVWQGTL